MFLDSLRTLSFKYAKCIIPRNLMYLYILKSYYRLKVLYHAIPPFAMDLLQKGTEVFVVRVWSSGTVSKGSHKQVILQHVYLTDTANADGGMELTKLPWMRFYFLDFLKSRSSKTAQPTCGFQGLHGITDLENENSCVQKTPAPWRCI